MGDKTKLQENSESVNLEVEDELHFLITCQKLSQRRSIFEQNITYSIQERKSLNNLT